MTKSKQTHGGAREGAGRPITVAPEDRPVSLAVRVHPTIRETFIRDCQRRGISQADAVTLWVKRMKPVTQTGALVLLAKRAKKKN